MSATAEDRIEERAAWDRFWFDVQRQERQVLVKRIPSDLDTHE